MKDKFKNSVEVQGYVFSHTLQNRVSKKGVPFINGEIQIATDTAGTNVVPVHFTYVTETYGKSGKANNTYTTLQDIIDNGVTYEEAGTNATKVRVSGNVGVNDFYTREGELASPKRVEGSFVHTMYDDNFELPNFDVDMLISRVVEREREDEPNYLELHGYVFDFRKNILPIVLTVHNSSGIDYFLDQDISNSNPLFTELRGEIVSTVLKNEIKVEGAFGEPMVRTTTRTLRAWDVNWASLEPMTFDDPSSITKDELKEALAAREQHLLDEKERYEQYQASRNGGQSFASTPTDSDSGDFEF